MHTQTDFPAGFIAPDCLSGLPSDTPVLVAFSGGSDSSVLLHLLVKYGKETGAEIYAAHINHSIRGAEADRDEEFCKSVCASLGVELFTLKADVAAIAKERGVSVETAARDVRYGFFDEIMEKHGISLLATAHNADDNLETVIFNITRGAGLAGVCGIPQTRSCKHGTVIRPILYVSKPEILAICSEQGIDFVTDSTNTHTDYTRNKIRAEIIPRLTEINEGAVRNAARMSASLREDALCLDSMRDMFLEGFLEDGGIETEKLNGSPAAVVNRALAYLYRSASEGQSLEAVHIDALKELSKRAVPHSSVSLPCGMRGVIENGRLYVEKIPEKRDIPTYSQPLSEGYNRISQTNCEIIILPSQNAKNVYKNSIISYIDSAKINDGIYARSRQEGDRILLGGMHKSVKKLLCDKKIPLDTRARLPMICDREGILAIPTVAVRDGCKARNDEGALAIIFRECKN